MVGWLGGEGHPEGAPRVDSTPSSLPASHSWPSFLSTTGYTNIGICVSDVLCIQSSRLCGFKFFVAEFLFSISTQTFQFCHRCNLDFLMDYFKNEPKVDNLFSNRAENSHLLRSPDNSNHILGSLNFGSNE